MLRVPGRVNPLVSPAGVHHIPGRPPLKVNQAHIHPVPRQASTRGTQRLAVMASASKNEVSFGLACTLEHKVTGYC